MSDVVEKTLASLPKVLSESLLGGPPSPRKTTSRGFQNFARLINKARSKQEEDHVVKHELMLIQQQLSQPDTSQLQVCDSLCRLIYSCMLGYDVSFGYIHAIKLAQSTTAVVKRTGYLASSLMLHEDHELILLLINTIQKDLQSSNMLHNCIALNAVCQLVNSEMIPMVLPLVQEKLRHPRELVRAKAVTCMHRFVLKTPSLVQHCLGQFIASLCDKDPGVMAIAVNIYYHLVKRNPENFHSLVPILVNILQQIVNGRLPASFEYHSIPLPWLQIQILRILAILGKSNLELSQQMYSVLKEVLQRVNMKEYIAFGIMYDCIATITTIYPDEELFQEAAKCVGRFIRSSDYNLKYIGVKSLTSLVKGRPESALDYQMIVVELLDDPDYAIQQKTLELLYNMANPVNVQVVCDRLLDHMTRSTNKYWLMNIVAKVTDLADRFSTSGQWYVDIMIKLLQINKTSIPRGVVNKIITAVQKETIEREAKGCDMDSSSTNKINSKDFKQHLIKKCVECLFIEDVSSELVKVSVWVLGEFADMLKNMPEDKIISLFLKQFTKSAADVNTKLWIVSSMLKLTSCNVLSSAVINKHFTDLEKKEENVLVKQKLQELIRCAEINPQCLIKNGRKVSQVDFTLSFLDDYVSISLEKGGIPYKPSYLRRTRTSELPENKSVFSGIGQSVYSNPSPASSGTGQKLVKAESLSSESVSESSQNLSESGLKLKGVPRVWGKEGFIGTPGIDSLARPVSSMQGSFDSSQQSSPTGSEKDVKKKELASALFGGISPQKKLQSNEDDNGDDQSYNKSSESKNSSIFDIGRDNELDNVPVLPKSDSGGWRKLHQTAANSDVNVLELAPLHNSIGQAELPPLDRERNLSDSLYEKETEHSTENETYDKLFSNNCGSDNVVSSVSVPRNVSDVSMCAPKNDYFNPVTGNWELDINHESNFETLSKPANKSQDFISGNEFENEYSADNATPSVNEKIKMNDYSSFLYTSADSPPDENFLGKDSSPPPPSPPPDDDSEMKIKVAMETKTTGSLYDDFME